jgi:hypothetical protein
MLPSPLSSRGYEVDMKMLLVPWVKKKPKKEFIPLSASQRSISLHFFNLYKNDKDVAQFEKSVNKMTGENSFPGNFCRNGFSGIQKEFLG